VAELTASLERERLLREALMAEPTEAMIAARTKPASR
jgi:hypothetical protein